MIAQPSNYLTPVEYLEWEEKQDIKYEYVKGEVFAMTGGTVAHGTIAANLFYQLKNHLRGKGCRPFIFDVKLGLSEKGPFYYPDVMVTCDERDRNASKIIKYPCLIAEVLSPGTEAYDRGEKFKNYRNLPSLKEYLLINSDKMYVECFRLSDRRIWELHSYNQDQELQLTSLNFSGAISLLYEDVEFV